MATILEFRRSQASRAATAPTVMEGMGELVLFTGVRYERAAEMSDDTRSELDEQGAEASEDAQDAGQR